MKQFLTLIFMALMFTSCGFEIVDTGHVGVKRYAGSEIVETNIKPGVALYMPFFYGIAEVDVRLNKYEGALTLAQGAPSKDNQNVALTYAVNYSYDPAESGYIFEQGNEAYADKVLPQVVIENIRQVIGQYNAEEIAQKLGEVSGKINAQIADAKIKGILLPHDAVSVTNTDFSDEFEHAVEQKVVAAQKAKQEENNSKAVNEKALQMERMAEAQARTIQVKAEALAKNPALVEFERVQRWDGKMPTTIIGGGSMPMINLGTLK